MRRFVVLSMVAVAAFAAIAPVAQGRLAVTMHTSGHHPKVGKRWAITISAFNGSKRVCGHVRYAFLFHGRAVAHRNAGVGGDFCGHFKDPNILWPKRAIGIPLTFRAVVDTKLGQRNLDYGVQVVR